MEKTFLEFCNMMNEMHHSDFAAAAAMPEPARRMQLSKSIEGLDSLARSFYRLLFHQNPRLAEFVLEKFQEIKIHVAGALGGEHHPAAV